MDYGDVKLSDELDMTPNTEYETEAALLGSVICDERCLDELAQDSPDMFFYEDHRKVFLAMRSMRAAQKPIDLLGLKYEMIALGTWEKLGVDGPATFISQLWNAVPCAANSHYYAQRLRSCLAKRQLAASLVGIDAEIADPSTTGAEVVADAEARVKAISPTEDGGPMDVSEVARNAFEEARERMKSGANARFVPTGLANIDAITRGLPQGGVTILAGRTSTGKTSLMLRMVEHAAVVARVPTVVFSLEMRPVGLFDHIVCARVGVSSRKFEEGLCNECELAAYTDSFPVVKDSPLKLDAPGELSPAKLRQRVRLIQKTMPVRLVVVDYLGLMRPDHRTDNQQQNIASVSRSLKVLAMELDVAMLVLCQLNRATEGRGEDDRKPRLSDLRDSGAIENDADIVMLLFRNGYYHSEDQSGITSLNVAKQRHGATKECTLKFFGDLAWFESVPDAR